MSREIPTILKVTDVTVRSSGDLAVWSDQERTKPVTTLNLLALNLKPPLKIDRTLPRRIYVENRSDIVLTIIEPCRTVFDSSGNRIGWMDPEIRTPDNKDHLGSACDRNVRIGPGQMVRMNLNIHDLEPLAPGDYPITTVIGATGFTGDAPSGP